MSELDKLYFNVDPVKLNTACLSEIDKRGYVYPSEELILSIPDEDKVFSVHISELSDDDLLNKMAICSALLARASMDEATSSAEVSGLERDLEFTKAKILQLSSQTKVTDKRQEALVNEEVVKLQEKLQVAETKERLYSALRTTYDKFVFLYSRALTIRTDEKRLQ